MDILIIGGAGFVGSNLANYMKYKGHKITVYDNLSRSNKNLDLLKGCDLIKGELDDIPELLNKRSFDIIYHFAAQVAVTASYQSPRSDFRINAAGTFNVVNSSGKTPVIFASTNKVYGNNVNEIPIEEEKTRYDFGEEFKGKGIPETFSIDSKHHTPYGCSKLTGDLYVREYGGVVNRFSCMYGPNQFGNEDQGWVAHFVLSKLRGDDLNIYGNGKQVRDLLFIEDVIELLELEANNITKIRGEAFNIGGGYNNTMSLLELCDLLDIKKLKYGEERPADQRVYYSDITKAKNLLNWEPIVNPREGIKSLESWARNYLSR